MKRLIRIFATVLAISVPGAAFAGEKGPREGDVAPPILGTSIDGDTLEVQDRAVFRAVSQKLTSFQLTVAHDYGNRGSDAYGVNGIPHMVIIGRDGVILKVNRGYSEESLDGILAEINAALQGPAG